MTSTKTSFKWDDPFLMDSQLSDEERMVQATKHAKDVLVPRVLVIFGTKSLINRLLKKWEELVFWVRLYQKYMVGLVSVTFVMGSLLER